MIALGAYNRLQDELAMVGDGDKQKVGDIWIEARRRRQLLVMFGVYLFMVGSFNHVQTSSGVQVQGHPGEQLPWGYCEVTFAHSS